MSYIFSRALVEAYLAASCSECEPFAPSNSNPIPQACCSPDKMTGLLPPFPVWDDVRTFDGRRWRGLVDVVSGGFPCQDISAAGKGAGIDGARSGLWREMHRIINEIRPEFAFLENSPLLVGRGLARVLGDLAEIGYDAEWLVLGADDVGAPHVRKRIWILAHDPHANGLQRPQQGEPFTGSQEPDGCSDNRLDAGDDVANAPCGEVQRGKPGVMAGPICSRKSINSTAGTGREICNPQARDFRTGEARRWEDPARSRNLNDQIAKFPTPTSRDWKDSGSSQGNRKSPNLGTIASRFPTPRTKGMCGGSGAFQKMKALEAEGIVTTEERKQMTAGNGGQLNPTWTEWLNGVAC